jgi:hypothetical protein
MKTVSVSAHASLIDRMSDYRAREMAKAIDAGDADTADKWANMKVPEFLDHCRDVFKEPSDG